MTGRIRLLYIITALNIGGAEMMLYRKLQCLNRDQFEVVVVSLIDKGHLGKSIETELGIPVYELGLKRFINFYKAVSYLGKIIKDYKPDIVHSHMFHANIFSRVIRLFFYYPILICTIHNLDEKGRRKSAYWREKAYRFTDRMADFTTQVSRAGLAKYLSIGAVSPGKLAFMPNGIDLSLFKIDAKISVDLRRDLSFEDSFVFLAVGSLTFQKDYPNMLNAFLKVSEKEPAAVLVIVGEGPLKNDLRKLCIEMGLTDKVKFLGLRTDVPVLMKMADCFVMSSAWEGLPIVLLEAAAAGLPIIATNVGGNSEVVLDGENGFLVLSKDSDALGNAMLKIVRMPENIRAKFGVKGYNHVSNNYDIRQVTEKWEKIYTAMKEGILPVEFV